VDLLEQVAPGEHWNGVAEALRERENRRDAER